MASEEKMRQIIPIETQGIVWLTVVANCQLAFRHPDNDTDSTKVCRQFIDQLIQTLLEFEVVSQDEIDEMYRNELRMAEEQDRIDRRRRK